MSSINRLMSPPPVYDARSPTTLKPYLELRHLLSLTWLAYPILSLIFVIFRLQLSLSSSQEDLANAKGDLLAGCKAAEQAATAAASMPRYMAAATNRQFADAVNGSMDGARAALVLSLTVMETIINFIIDTYRSTLLCFVELVIRGGLAILISAVQEINSFVQSTAGSIRTSIQNDISTANSAIASAVSGLNKVNPFGTISVPQFNIPSLSALQNITLPTDFEDALTQLNSSIPSFADIKQKLDALVDTPFELLKQDINDTFTGLSFDSAILPVPELNSISFCNDIDLSVVDDLGRDLIKVARIGTIILIFLAFLLLAANCALEWYKWRCTKRHFEYTRQAWVSDPTVYHSGSAHAPQITLSDHNLFMLRANGTHPLLTRIANTLATRLGMSPSQHTHLSWFFHYVFHPPALACFLIGFFGLLSVQLQLLAISPLEARFEGRAASTVADISNTIATSVNNSMYNQSSLYANDINGRVDLIQNSINNGVFGWVNGTTTILNDTLVEFYNDIQNAVSSVFNGTVLESPAQDFIKCILGSKVDALENALTFLNQNLNVNMPRVNESVLVLSPSQVDEATRPIAAAAIGTGQGDDQGLVGRLVNTYAASLKKERFAFGIFMGLWGVVVLIALGIILWNSYGRQLVEARKKRKWQKEQRSGFEGIVVPFKEPRGKGDDQEVLGDLRSFTPMPSPGPVLTVNGPFNRPADHPLNSLEPKFERSWDSFFGQNTAPAVDKRTISLPMKLKAVGQKAMGDKFVGDVEKSVGAEETQRNDVTWLGRVKGMLWRRGATENDTGSERTVSRDQSRPTLRISIEHPSERSPTADQPPNSAWSVSPTHPNMAWMNRIVPTKRQQTPSPPIPPKPRSNANVPSDVNSTYEDSAIAVSKTQPSALAIPLHSGFERSRTPPLAQSSGSRPQFAFPPPPSRPHNLAPPRDRHRRSSSVPAALLDMNAQAGSTTPVTRLLTTTHARQSSSVNPFSTPFDDEHRVADYAAPNARTRTQANPFAAVAL